MCIRVDFPDPEGPTMATYSPESIVNETPRSAATEMVPVRYTLVTWPSEMTGLCSAGACCTWPTGECACGVVIPPPRRIFRHR